MWSIELVKLLICKYRLHENLYNEKDPCYFDQSKRANSMLRICTELKEFNGNVTVDDVQEKIRTLRLQFTEELQYMAAYSGQSSSNDIYEPKLWCFEQMEFLRPHCDITELKPIFRHSDENNINIGKSEDLFDANSASESDTSNPCLTDLTDVSESDDLEIGQPNSGSLVSKQQQLEEKKPI